VLPGLPRLVFQTGNGGGKRPPRPPSLRNSYLRFLRGWMLTLVRRRGGAERVGGEPLRLPPVFHAGLIEGIDSREYLLYLAERIGERADERRGSPVRPALRVRPVRIATRHPGSSFPCTGESATSRITVLEKPAGTASSSVEQPQLLLFPARASVAVRGNVFERCPAAKIFFARIFSGRPPKEKRR